MADDALYYSGLDPRVNTFDLGTDPLVVRRAAAQARPRAVAAHRDRGRCKPGENYALLRRNFNRGLFEVQQSARAGGEVHRRPDAAFRSRRQRPRAARAGSGGQAARSAQPPRRRPCSPPTSFRFSPAFLSRLAITDFDIDDARVLGRSVPTVDVAVDQQVLEVHRSVLAPLLGPEIAQRLLNNELKVRDPTDALTARRALCDAASRDLERARDRRGHSAHPPQPAARIRLARRRARRPARRRPCPPTRARCCAPTRRSCAASSRRRQKRNKISAETTAHVADSLATARRGAEGTDDAPEPSDARQRSARRRR